MAFALTDLLNVARVASSEAARAILDVYASDFSSREKEDKSPLTEADLASHQVLMAHLEKTGIPVLSEESAEFPYAERSSWETFWLVDPLDGTKEFLKRNGEFTVNVALIQAGQPVLGVVHVPVSGQVYHAAKGLGAFVIDDDGTRAIAAEKPADGHLKVVASRSHSGPDTEAYIDGLRSKYVSVELVSKGSSLKICMVAEGAAHVYPRLGPTMEWDTAAAHAVALEAGCTVTDFEGVPLSYNKENLLNPHFLVSAPLG